jgi:hypothetical protein
MASGSLSRPDAACIRQRTEMFTGALSHRNKYLK